MANQRLLGFISDSEAGIPGGLDYGSTQKSVEERGSRKWCLWADAGGLSFPHQVLVTAETLLYWYPCRSRLYVSRQLQVGLLSNTHTHTRPTCPAGAAQWQRGWVASLGIHRSNSARRWPSAPSLSEEGRIDLCRAIRTRDRAFSSVAP